MKKNLSIIALIALVAVCCVALMACLPSDPKDARKNLEDEDYVVANELAIKTGLTLAGIKSIADVVVATKDEDYVVLVYFESKDAAKEAYAQIEEYAKGDDEDAVIKQSGKIVYFGTEAGIKAAK